MSIALVSAKAGLTNHYHQQVIRNPVMNIHSTFIDQLTHENHAGGVKGTTLQHAAVMAGGLNMQASGMANIQEGWGSSKGLMMLDFVTQDSPVFVEYMHVLGYITNNQSLEGLTPDAVFHPVMSWKTQETITSNFGDIQNPTSIQRKTGHRTDYMFNDGSNHESMVTLRPSDVIEYGLEKALAGNVMDQMIEEGLDGFQPTVNPANSSISRAGVIASKRSNTNPTAYATDILTAGTNYQRNSMMQGSTMDIGGSQTQFDGMYGELNNLSYQANQHEPNIMRDPFFREMMQSLGIQQTRGFNGYSIGDLLMAFGNLDDVLDLTFMAAEDFQAEDFTLNTQSFGTSQMGEVVAAEIEACMLDLMLKYGISMISFRGSNCDNWGGDGALDNIVIIPFNPSSLQDDDFQLGQKCDAFVEAMRTQIFTKLNGMDMNSMMPLRFYVNAEMFGTTTIDLQVVNSDNVNSGFALEESDSQVGIVRVFPTFAINSTSPILGNSDSAQMAGSNFFSNIESYFQ